MTGPVTVTPDAVVMPEWFCALLDSAADVYFRYALEPLPRLAYVSPSIQALTGHSPMAFYENANLCATVVVKGDRHLLRRVLRSRRGLLLTLHVVRDGLSIPVELRTAAVVRDRRLVAIEGVARLVHSRRAMDGARPAGAAATDEPTQQRLAALMYEVHALLHRVLPAGTTDSPLRTSHSALRSWGVLVYEAIELDCDRLLVTDAGRAVSLTTREVMVLRYFLERQGRVVTRQQLLSDVWNYSYTGDDRTVDVHISRLRKKLPSLRGRLAAIREVGYRLEAEEAKARRA